MSVINISKITGIFLEKFQTIVDPTFVKLDKLTFLYGPNSAGKSSIIDALKVLANFAGIKQDEDLSFRGYSDKYSSRGYGSLKVGIEFIYGKAWSLLNTVKEKEWWNSPNRKGEDFFHQDFFIELFEKKIQIQISDSGESIALAVEGEPLFEIAAEYFRYDIFCNPLQDGDDGWDDNDDRTIAGKIKFYKKNKLLKLICPDILKLYASSSSEYFDKNSPFYKLLINEDSETLNISGITFEADERDYNNQFVSSWFGLNELLNESYEDLLRFTDLFENPEIYTSFLDAHFSKNPVYSQREKFKNLIDEISEVINKIIYGLRFGMADALLHSHVKGNRGVLNSDLCFSYLEENQFKLESNMHGDKNFMSSYAENLLKNDFKYRNYNGSFFPFSWGENSIKFDFINTCFSKYLPSLKQYSIKAVAGNIELPNLYFESSLRRSRKSPIYLVLRRDKNNYGFQDVGSGLSYIFPILTSLTAVNLSLVEQPELHLHPASQCELGDVFLAARHYGSIAIVESHSEHILLRILRRIRETTNGFLLREELKVKEDDVRIYYFEPHSNGTTNIKEIKVDKYGELLNTWPGGFFSEREKELFGE